MENYISVKEVKNKKMERTIDMERFLSEGDWKDLSEGIEMALVYSQGEVLGNIRVHYEPAEMKHLLTKVGRRVVSGTYLVFSESSIWKSKWKSSQGFLDWIERIYDRTCQNRYLEYDGSCTMCGEFHTTFRRY